MTTTHKEEWQKQPTCKNMSTKNLIKTKPQE